MNSSPCSISTIAILIVCMHIGPLNVCGLSNSMLALVSTGTPHPAGLNDLSIDSIDAWLGRALVSDDYDTWLNYQEELQQAVLHNFVRSSELLGVKKYLFLPWKTELTFPEFFQLQPGQELRLTWMLIQAKWREKQVESSILDEVDQWRESPRVFEPDAPRDWNFIRWMITSLCIALSVILLIPILRNRWKARIEVNSAFDVEWRKAFEHVGDNTTNRFLIAKLQFQLGMGKLSLAFKDHSGWRSLSASQQLIAHLISSSISNDFLLTKFGYSKGHYYNERSAIRRALKIPNEENLDFALRNFPEHENRAIAHGKKLAKTS